MRALLGLLLLSQCIALGAATRDPILTIKSPDGDTIDCVDTLAQPAFSHPLLIHHKLQETPKNLPNLARKEAPVTWQTWHSSGSTCPKGTIPLRRVVSQKDQTTNSRAGAEVTLGHEYAIGHLNTTGPIYGTKVTMSVSQPKVELVNEFSLAQIWLVSGSYEDGDMNTIEVGWQVFPELYSDYQPRFFIFWTRDAYTRERCYNLRCPGFIQTSGSILVEGAISLMSTSEGPKSELTIQIWKDPNLGHWWLAVGANNGAALAPVGYWPTEIFTRLTDYAENVQWGGEIVNRNISGQHTSTQMGSGYFPSSAKAATMHNMEVAGYSSQFQPVHNLIVGATNPTYYDIKKLSNTSFAYGGPEHAGAVHLRLDLYLFYFCFSLLLLF